jgi:hypothetical protein
MGRNLAHPLLDYQLEVLCKIGGGQKARKHSHLLLRIAEIVPESTIMAALAATQDARNRSLDPELKTLRDPFSYYIGCLKNKGVDL